MAGVATYTGSRWHQTADEPEVGRRLIAGAEERFRELGGSRVDAVVLDANDLAHGVWAAHGYVPQDNWSRWVKPLL